MNFTQNRLLPFGAVLFRVLLPWCAVATPVDQTAVANFVSSYVPSNMPQAVQLLLHDGYASRTFNWQTAASTTVGEVRLLEGAYDAARDALFDQAPEIFRRTASRTGESSPPLSRFSATVGGLTPGATYSYRLGSPDGYVYGRFTVRSFAASSAVTIVNFNDFQTKKAATFYKVVKSAQAAAETIGGGRNADLVVNGGDLFDVSALTGANHVKYGTDVPASYKAWKRGLALDAVTPFFPGVPWMNVEGNHDDNWETCASADVGAVHVVTMPFLGTFSESTRPEYRAAVAAVNADLRAAADAKWKIVCIHWGPYTTGDHGREHGMEDAGAKRADLLRMLAPTFASNRVDLVLQAHDHTYSKTVPYRWDAAGWTTSATDAAVLNLAPEVVTNATDGAVCDVNPRGTYYASIGCSGPRTGEDVAGYSLDTGANSYKTRLPVIAIGAARVASRYKAAGAYASGDFDAQTFGILSVRGNRLDFSFYVAEEDGTATLFDAIHVVKRAGDGLTLIVR